MNKLLLLFYCAVFLSFSAQISASENYLDFKNIKEQLKKEASIPPRIPQVKIQDKNGIELIPVHVEFTPTEDKDYYLIWLSLNQEDCLERQKKYSKESVLSEANTCEIGDDCKKNNECLVGSIRGQKRALWMNSLSLEQKRKFWNANELDHCFKPVKINKNKRGWYCEARKINGKKIESLPSAIKWYEADYEYSLEINNSKEYLIELVNSIVN